MTRAKSQQNPHLEELANAERIIQQLRNMVEHIRLCKRSCNECHMTDEMRLFHFSMPIRMALDAYWQLKDNPQDWPAKSPYVFDEALHTPPPQAKVDWYNEQQKDLANGFGRKK